MPYPPSNTRATNPQPVAVAMSSLFRLKNVARLPRHVFKPPPHRDLSAKADLGKQDLVNIVSTNCSLTKTDAKVAVDAIFDSIQAAVAQGDKISIPGFGSFERSIRSARQGRNPATGESLFIPESATPTFKAGSTFKGLVKERYSKQ